MTSERSGTVYLVGAGPGDPRLATKRALDLIASADVIVYDRLVAPRLLEGARPDAELIYAGKRPGQPSIGQTETNDLLVDRARKGKRVVRLKGGDPFVFGRGGEEAEALSDAGISFEVVPGVTAGVAAAALAGIPVTHRDLSSAVAFVTGHEDPAKDESAIDWSALATFPGTLVFYMGVRNLGLLADRLIEHGRSPDEPAAVVERASLPEQRTITGPLAAIARIAAAESVEPPAVTIVGQVAALRERLAWLEGAPLHGRTVVVTRARAQASVFAERLSALGAAVIEAPAIRIEPRSDDPDVKSAVERIARNEYDLICLTSPNGAELLLRAVARTGRDSRVFAGTTLAAIGPGTSAVLSERGLAPDVVPERSIAEELATDLAELPLAHKRALVARASVARDVLPDRLREQGAEVDVVALYDTIPEELDEATRAAVAEADYVTFTSSSTVRHFLTALGGTDRFPRAARVVSIGPVTSDTVRELGLEIHVEAEQHDLDGLVQALLDDALSRGLASN